jgi:photosystem II stability/assembly factor-like uncharacterized protein
MKRAGGRFAALLATAVAVASFVGGNVGGQGGGPGAKRTVVDPDLPPQMQSADKEAFLRARFDHVALLRGDYRSFLPYNPRLRALQELIALEARTPQIDPAFWTQIGPAPIPNGQTQGVVNPVSGRTTAIAIHPANPDIVYVGAAQGGVYRSLDGGANWTPIFDSALSLAIGSVVLAPSNPEILYVGTGEPNGSQDSFFGVGLYRIDNASTTATLTGPINPPVATGIPGTTAFTGRAISQVLVHPTDPNTIFVSTYTGTGTNPGQVMDFDIPPLGILGLYRSTDATSPSPTFTKLTVTTAGSVPPDTTGNQRIRDIVFDPVNPNTLVAWVYGTTAPGDGGIYRTTNALAPNPTFTQVHQTTTSNTPAELTANNVGGVTRMWLASGESNGRVRRSTDAGATWSGFLTGGINFCNPQCFYDIAIAAHPTNANIVHLGGSPTTVHDRSTDGGDTFQTFESGLHVDTHAIEIAPSNPSVVYFGSDGGIWRSSDGGVTWLARNNTSFHATQFQSIAIHPTNPQFLIGGTQDNGTNFLQPDGTWIRADGGDGGYSLIDQNAVDLVNVTQYHTYFNTLNSMGFARRFTAVPPTGGWNVVGCGMGVPNGITCPSQSILFYAPMTLGPGSPNTVYFGSDQVWRSTNNGTNMSSVSQVLSPGATGAVVSIGISPQNDNVRIAGTRNGKLFATTTGANPMVDHTNAAMPQPHPADPNQRRPVTAVAVDPTNINVAYAAFGGYGVAAGHHIWKTLNLSGGAGDWFPSGFGLPDVPVNSMVIDPGAPFTIYAGTDIGVFVTQDGGANWVPYTTGMPRVTVFSLTFLNAGGTRVIRAGTHGRGVWERTPLDVPVKLQGIEVQ